MAIDYTLELTPATPEGRGMCVQGCGHCPFNVEDYKNSGPLTFSDRQHEAAWSFYKALVGRTKEALGTTNIAGYFPNIDYGSLPYLGETSVIGLLAGPISDYDTKESLQSLVDTMHHELGGRFQKTRGAPTKVFPSFRDNDALLVQEDTMGQALVSIMRYGIAVMRQIDPFFETGLDPLCVSLDGNNIERELFEKTTDMGTVAKMLVLIDGLTQHGGFTPYNIGYDRNETSRTEPKFCPDIASGLFMLTSTKDRLRFEFSYRYIAHGAKDGPLRSDIISLYPRAVKIGHSTTNINDIVGWMSYSDFNEVVSQAHRSPDRTIASLIEEMLEDLAKKRERTVIPVALS